MKNPLKKFYNEDGEYFLGDFDGEISFFGFEKNKIKSSYKEICIFS